MPSSRLHVPDPMNEDVQSPDDVPGDDVQSADGGEARSVAQLFGQYRRYVAAIGGRILRNRAEVDDLVQDVFLATHQDLHGLRDVSSTRAWLATITVRLAHRSLRHHSRQQRIAQIEPYTLSLMHSVAPAADLQSDLTGSAERLRELPRRLRKPWLLKHIEGESLHAIAEHCDCSPSTAQRRIRTATQRLRAS
jgi:RNA polymerase sigma-70 factor, ECF subfamily